MTTLRDAVKEEIQANDPKKIYANVPACVRDAGVVHAVHAYKSNKRKQAKQREAGEAVIPFTLHERKCPRRLKATFPFGKRAIKRATRPHAASRTVNLDFRYNSTNPSIRELGALKVREGKHGDLNDKLNFLERNTVDERTQKEDVSFEYDARTRRWYVHVSYDAVKTPQKPISECREIAAIDLGIRTPATVVGLTNGEFSTPFPANIRAEIHKRWRRIEALQSTISKRCYGRARQLYGDEFARSPKSYERTTRRMKQLLARLHLKLTRWMEHTHKTTAKFLVDRYDGVVCPPLGSLMMRQANDTRAQKKIKRRCRRLSSAMSLRKFTNALSYAAKRDGKFVVTARALESGTSMTCGNCGWRHEELGHETTFQCRDCGMAIDRDINGARNNGLQALSDGGYGRTNEYWTTI